jgi:AcrR family transcriptional regulator
MAVQNATSPRLLDAGVRTFARFGYHGATSERIAAEAGVSRVTLHRRGITKDSILAELAERATERYRGALWPALTGTGSGAERLAAALEALCEQAEEHLDLLVALRSQMDAVFHEPGTEPLTRSVFTEPLERLLRDGAQDGSLREVDYAEVATVVFNLVGWTYVHLRSGHGWAPERTRRHLLDVALDGLRPRAGTS